MAKMTVGHDVIGARENWISLAVLGISLGCGASEKPALSTASHVQAPAPSSAAASPNEPSPAAPTPSEDFRLPRSQGRVLGIRHSFEVRVTKTELFAGGRKLIALPSLAEMEGVGAGPDLKRAGVHDLYIVPLGAAVEQSKTPAASAVLYVDRSIPFRMLIETIFTIWQSGFGRIILATEGDAAPSAGETHGFLLSRPEEGEQRMGAYVLFLVNSGISVKLLGENVGEECKDIAPGIAVPRKAGAHDFAGLTRCLALLKPRAEQATRTHLVDPNLGYVTAAPKTSYEDIIHALQSLHDAGIGGVGFKVPQ